MVQIRESLPLLDGDATLDSASLTAGLAANQLHPDVRTQLANDKLISNFHTDDIDIDTWLSNVAVRIGQESLPLLTKSCHLVKARSQAPNQVRSGAFATGIGMTDILAYLFQDETALVGAMLYRSARRNLIGLDEIAKEFGDEVAQLVKDSLSLGKLSESIERNRRLEDYFNSSSKEQLSSIYSMLINTTEDVRAVLIKLAERTFAMRELSFASTERQKRVAQEVMTIYAPLAHRLGIAQLKWELEDLAFRYLEPDEYKKIAKLLAEKRIERESYIERVQDALKTALNNAGIQGEVTGRVKHIYSIWRKMKKKNLSFNQLYDIRALRVLVNTNAECYHTLGIVHGLWRHIPEQFDDYITNPKPNGYKSLHTAVIAEGKSLEVQIRTLDMHFEAELGKCSHVNYKEGLKGKKDAQLDQKLSSLRQLLAGEKADDDDNNNLDNNSTIYLFSKDGDILELPKGATVLDFAYHIHTEVGNRAQGARVNGLFVPLTHQPKTGEQVEIITKQSREPNRDWLIDSLGYINTPRAKSKLKGWFNKQDREKNIETGKLLLTKELERLSLDNIKIDEILTHLNQKNYNLKNSDELYLGLVVGELNLTHILNFLQEKFNKDDDNPTVITKKQISRPNKYKIDLDGLDNVELHLAKCCNPVHGESIAGFITKSSGVSIHNSACIEYHRLIADYPDCAIKAYWQESFGRYQPVTIGIEAYDRRGLLRDLTQLIDKEKVNIFRAETLSTDDNIAHIKFSVEVAGLSHLSRLLAKIESQPSVISARRVGG